MQRGASVAYNQNGGDVSKQVTQNLHMRQYVLVYFPEGISTNLRRSAAA